MDATNKIYGYEIRRPYQSELLYFHSNPHVGGMAAEDGKIILNPVSMLKPEEKMAVARNEAARLYMRENKIVPNFDLTAEQKASFANTEYGSAANEPYLKSTIASRILTGDPSAGAVTQQQKDYAAWLQSQLEARK
jgi:hypothetical protein